MSFVSWAYYLLLLITALLFYLVPGSERKKKVLALASGIFVLLFHWISFLFLSVLAAINYRLLCKLGSTVDLNARKRLFRFGIGLNISALVLYKLILALAVYQGAGGVQFWKGVGVILGLSFYGLQLIGFYFEVYQKRFPFKESFTDYFLSLAFFPKITAGPILKLNNNTGLHQLGESANWEMNITYGIQRILLGLFKKVALADRLAPLVAEVFDSHKYLSGLHIYLGVIMFTAQLYLDFSGYIDIALGSARIFGVRLPENFNLPLRAVSIADFWRRWHISLIDWLTAYVFYPISYRYRKFKAKGLFYAVAVTFLISAVWHGLAITFLVWSICHIVYLVAEHRFFPNAALLVNSSNRWRKAVQAFVVVHLVSFANIFFRSNSMADATQLFGDFARIPFLLPEGASFKGWLINGGQDIEHEFNYRLSVFLCLVFLLLERRISRPAFSERYHIGYVTAALVLLVVFGYFNGGEKFLYNNF